MQFRYDVGEKLDLSQFKKHAEKYIRTNSNNIFQFYMHDFIVEIRTFYNDIPIISNNGFSYKTGIRVTVRIFDIKRANSEIIDKKNIHVFFMMKDLIVFHKYRQCLLKCISFFNS